MDFLEKLDYLMEKYDLNKSSFSQKSGIPYTTIDAWYKKGYEGLKLTTLRKIANYFNTSLDYWILDEITDPNHGKSSGFKIDYSEMEHIQKYRNLDPHGKDMVDTVLEKEYKRWEVEKKQKDNNIIKLDTPEYFAPNAARPDEDGTDEERKVSDSMMEDDSEWT